MGSWKDLLTDDERSGDKYLRSCDEGRQDAAGPVVGEFRQVTQCPHLGVQRGEARHPLRATGSAGQEPWELSAHRAWSSEAEAVSRWVISSSRIPWASNWRIAAMRLTSVGW